MSVASDSQRVFCRSQMIFLRAILSMQYPLQRSCSMLTYESLPEGKLNWLTFDVHLRQLNGWRVIRVLE